MREDCSDDVCVDYSDYIIVDVTGWAAGAIRDPAHRALDPCFKWIEAATLTLMALTILCLIFTPSCFRSRW